MKKIESLAVFTTNLCNLRCIYCSSGAGEKLENELTLADKKNIVLEAKKLGAKTIVLCGSGEPMIDPNFYDFIKFIRKRKLRVFVATNGTFINKKNAQWLLDNKVHILFKLNSFDPDITDTLVGKKNAYQWAEFEGLKIPYGLKCLLELGYHKLNKKEYRNPKRFLLIESIISRYNFRDIPKIAAFCKKYNLFFYLESLIWIGKAKDNYKDLELTKKQYKWTYENLKGKMDWDFFLDQKLVTCNIEKNPIVDCQGNLKICNCRNANAGNIRETPLAKLHNKAQKKRKSQSISFLNGLLNPTYFKTCAGREFSKKILFKEIKSNRN